MHTIPISWSHGRGAVQSLGAMLGPVDFLLPDGRWVSPLHVAPWENETLNADVPPILQSMRGEWPCVPFGAANIDTVNSRWRKHGAESESTPHGYASNTHWRLQTRGENSIDATIQYPEYSSIESLRRSIKGIDGNSALQISLSISSRTDSNIPIGLHPVFRLPGDVQDIELVPDNIDKVWTYPGDTGGKALFSKDAVCDSLTRIPAPSGVLLDASRLPFSGNSEDLLLLTGVRGRFVLRFHAERYRVILQWNYEDFPSLLLWISHRGRQEAPWSGRHLALGIEPICAAFDLGTDISQGKNPLSDSGVKTAVALSADKLWTTQYSICVESL